jgi:ubiquinone/menaquinone biosynthesis C-methylase UbiE
MKFKTQANREVFEEIAESWYRVRHWSRFSKELKKLSLRWQHGKLLNIGCAHGPDFLPFKEKDFDLYGIDFSTEMIRLAQKYSGKFDFNVNLTVADAVCLPFSNATFDWAIAIATYHHIEDATQRHKAFEELRRVLKPGGEALITVWNRGQSRFWFKGKEIEVPWKSKDTTFYRYYYLFSHTELQRELKKAGFQIIDMFSERTHSGLLRLFSRNICVLVSGGD